MMSARKSLKRNQIRCSKERLQQKKKKRTNKKRGIRKKQKVPMRKSSNIRNNKLIESSFHSSIQPIELNFCSKNGISTQLKGYF